VINKLSRITDQTPTPFADPVIKILIIIFDKDNTEYWVKIEDGFLSAAISGEKPVDAKNLVEAIISEAYTKGASDVNYKSTTYPDKNRVLF
jgi:hypothetical protein